MCVHLYKVTQPHPLAGIKTAVRLQPCGHLHTVVFVLSQHSHRGLWRYYNM